MGEASQYKYLMGMEKTKIKENLGQEFNYYSFNVWTYLLGSTWFGRKTHLAVVFENDIVVDVQIYQNFDFRGLKWNTSE